MAKRRKATLASTDATMNIANYLSGAAISISLLSLGLTAYLAFRDRSHISAAATYLSSFENMADAVYIHIVNDGRRPVTIRRLVVESTTGSRFEFKFQRNGRAIRLVESEDFEMALDSKKSEITSWVEASVEKAYIEDSKGVLYIVEGFAEILNANAENIKNAI